MIHIIEAFLVSIKLICCIKRLPLLDVIAGPYNNLLIKINFREAHMLRYFEETIKKEIHSYLHQPFWNRNSQTTEC